MKFLFTTCIQTKCIKFIFMQMDAVEFKCVCLFKRLVGKG